MPKVGVDTCMLEEDGGAAARFAVSILVIGEGRKTNRV